MSPTTGRMVCVQDATPNPPRRQRAGRVLRATGAATARGGRAGVRAVGAASKASARRFHAFVRADGADTSGLSRLTEMHTANSAADAALTISLAGTVFALPTGEARGQVALFLLLTMAPFVLLAPLVGPLLDRFRHGRRWAIGTTLALRAFLAWVLASALADRSAWVFPLALGALIASRSYAVARAAAVPRLLPEAVPLVTANSRITIAGFVGMLLGGGVASAVSRIGPDWAVRVAFLIYVAATVLAIRLPDRVDSAPAESTAYPQRIPALGEGEPSRPARGLRARLPNVVAGIGGFPPDVRWVLWLLCGSRQLSGFLTLYILFLSRERPLPGWGSLALMAAVAGAATVGTAVGSLLGNRRPAPNPPRVAAALMGLAVVAAVLAAVSYAAWTLIGLGFVAGLFAQLGKLGLDAVIQEQVPEEWHSRTFATTETVLQLWWVVGGAVAIAMPLAPGFAFGAVAVVLVAMTAVARWSRIHPIG